MWNYVPSLITIITYNFQKLKERTHLGKSEDQTVSQILIINSATSSHKNGAPFLYATRATHFFPVVSAVTWESSIQFKAPNKYATSYTTSKL